MSGTRVVAHRGASGHLPEHTAIAKTLAYGFGVDFLEQDLHASRDGELFVLHDPVLDDVSDVARRFPGRAREDGHYHVLDFTGDELRRLSLIERRATGEAGRKFPTRFAAELPGLHILSFAEEIRLVAELNRTTGRRVGLYPEIKHPDLHDEAGINVTALVAAALRDHAAEFAGPIFVQSFDSQSLQRMAGEFGSPWPLIKLLGNDDLSEISGNTAAMTAIREFAAGVGLPYASLIVVDESGIRPSRLARELSDTGLLVHPYTLRRDEPTPQGTDYFSVLNFLIKDLSVDALFCDYPEDALAVRASTVA